MERQNCQKSLLLKNGIAWQHKENAMNAFQKHKDRMEKIRKYKATSHLKEVTTEKAPDISIYGEVDPYFLQKMNVFEAYSNRIDCFELNVTDNEVNELISSLETEASADSILEPVFLGLLDGTMRAFNIGTKQGLTASRLYGECRSFSYESPHTKNDLDSITEHVNEQNNITEFGQTSNFANGKMSRDNEQSLNMRDGPKMERAKSEHLDGQTKSSDGYNADSSIFENKKHAKSQGKNDQSAETDHAVPCAEICNQLKSNKALNLEDIKEIVNIEENLVVTSKQNNRGSNTGKFDKSQDQLQQELDQGYVVNKSGKKTTLSKEDKVTRTNMVEKMKQSQESIDSATNEKVLGNVFKDDKTQKRLGEDAGNAASNQAIGDLILALIKPLYYELNDCFKNGIEKGVGESNFSSALKERFKRMKKHIMNKAKTMLEDGLFGFFKNFVTMLLEGILNCFVGIFKHVARIIKEGVKILFQIIPVLRDKNKNPAEKGDAILKLIASSVTIFAGIGIEAWLNSLGLVEPWSIIVASILSAVLTSLTMYLLDKIDLFGVNRDLKFQRVSEVLSMSTEEKESSIRDMLSPPSSI